ncbi:hypothetical protein ACLB2K_050430 [Fragaria x ananassa]
MRWIVDNIIGNNWNKQKLQILFDADIVDQICGILIPDTPQNDSFVSVPSPNRSFTIKSATWMQNAKAQPHEQSPLIKKLWKLNVPPKVKIFGWLVLRGRLKTRDRLHRGGAVGEDEDVGFVVRAEEVVSGAGVVVVAEEEVVVEGSDTGEVEARAETAVEGEGRGRKVDGGGGRSRGGEVEVGDEGLEGGVAVDEGGEEVGGEGGGGLPEEMQRRFEVVETRVVVVVVVAHFFTGETFLF